MAHFARIENGIVQEVIVVSNDELQDESGIESEAIGLAFLAETFGPDALYVQTSYNAGSNGFRGKYAGIGDGWDGSNFTTPKTEANL